MFCVSVSGASSAGRSINHTQLDRKHQKHVKEIMKMPVVGPGESPTHAMNAMREEPQDRTENKYQKTPKQRKDLNFPLVIGLFFASVWGATVA